MARSKISIEELRSAHADLGSVEKVGAKFGLSPSSVHERLQKADYTDWKSRRWTEQDEATLLREYRKCSEAGTLDGLAAVMGRTKQLLCRKAGALGLTGKNRPAPWARGNRFAADSFAIKGHPRGMAGKSHAVATRSAISVSQQKRWDQMTEAERDAMASAQLAGRMKSERNRSTEEGDRKKSWKSGWREIGPHRKYYRSRWEANYARYLEWLHSRGQILSWEHEPKTFWFEGIKRGVCSYKPDFRVIERSGQAVWHEVKGWMDDRSRVCLNRMRKFYPDEIVVLIDKDAYGKIKRTAMPFIEGWE